MKKPSSILRSGGLNFSGSGNMNTQLGSSTTSSIKSIFYMALILDYTNEALLALYLNLSINDCICAIFICWDSNYFDWLFNFSDLVFSNVS